MYCLLISFSALSAALATKENVPEELLSPPEDDEVVMLSMLIRNQSFKASPRTEEAPGPLLVKLERQLNRTASTPWQISTYVGSLYLGSPMPQHFKVSFDTASGQVMLPSSRCKSPACRDHGRYAPGASVTARDINSNGEPVKVDTGSLTVRRDVITIGVDSLDHGAGRAVGDLLREQVCIGKASGYGHCTELGIIAATNLTDVPFRKMSNDGIVGLGMGALTTSPFFHLLSQLHPGPGFSQSFGLFLGEKDGELALGGSNPKLQGPGRLSRVSVFKPEEGYWQVSIRAFRLGNRTLACSPGSKKLVSGCRGILDSSASGIGVPGNLAASLSRLLGSGCGGESLVLELEGSITLQLSPEQYQDHCTPMILPTQLPEALSDVFILGQPFFRKYYTVFDWGKHEIGFAPAAPSGFEAVQETQDNVTVLTTAQAEALEQQAILAEMRAQEEGTAPKSPGARIAAELLLEGLALQLFIMITFMLGVRAQPDIPVYIRITAARLTARICSLLNIRLPSSWIFTSLFLAVEAVSEKEMPEAADCVVCLGVREEECKCTVRPHWCRLRCGHAFHEECIFEWLQKTPRCPICRSHVLDSQNKKAEPGANEAEAPVPTP